MPSPPCPPNIIWGKLVEDYIAPALVLEQVVIPFDCPPVPRILFQLRVVVVQVLEHAPLAKRVSAMVALNLPMVARHWAEQVKLGIWHLPSAAATIFGPVDAQRPLVLEQLLAIWATARHSEQKAGSAKG